MVPIVSSSLSINAEVNSRNAKVAADMAKLKQWVSDNSDLSIKTKTYIFHAYVLSMFLYGSNTWTILVRHERKLKSFHMRCLQCMLHIK